MGRLATGLRRQYPFQLTFDKDEEEYSKRLSVETRTPRAELFRAAFFTGDWRAHLKMLREKQKKLAPAMRRELNGVSK